MELQHIDSTLALTKKLFPVDSTDLVPLVSNALVQLEQVQPLYTIWNRSNSDLAWNLINLSHRGDCRNLRQIGAELKQKRNALVEVNYAYKENILNAKILEEKATEQEGIEREKTLLLAEKERAFAVMKHEAIQGCTKDINVLKSSYDKIMKSIEEKHGKFDEEIFEKEETSHWIQTFYENAMRDIRECGHIRAGSQRDLEQMGIEPLEALRDISQFLTFVNSELDKGNTIFPSVLEGFLREVVKKHSKKTETLLDNRGKDNSHWTLIEGRS
jgi:bisphosphoglycerate-dependent phosphoglycerate mutase